jgi:hypothetical protein
MENCAQRFLQQINRKGVTIKQNLQCVMCLMCLLAVMTGPTYAANWVSVSGAETLRELVSGARAEIQLKTGVIAIYIAAKRPEGVPEENWLPLKRGDYGVDVIMRIYAPDLERFKRWKAPKAEKL